MKHFETGLSQVYDKQRLDDKRLLQFSIHKYNPYIADRTITLEEAAKCVVFQSKWAASHEQVDLNTRDKIAINVKVTANIELPRDRRFVEILISKGTDEFKKEFIVSESRSHFFFLDYSLLGMPNLIDVQQGPSGTASIATYSS